MMKRFCALLAVVACCIVCGCDGGKKTAPTIPPGGSGTPSTTTEGTKTDKPKEASNTRVDADETQMVKVSLSVPNMT